MRACAASSIIRHPDYELHVVPKGQVQPCSNPHWSTAGDVQPVKVTRSPNSPLPPPWVVGHRYEAVELLLPSYGRKHSLVVLPIPIYKKVVGQVQTPLTLCLPILARVRGPKDYALCLD